jgi:hypothetical protein
LRRANAGDLRPRLAQHELPAHQRTFVAVLDRLTLACQGSCCSLFPFLPAEFVRNTWHDVGHEDSAVGDGVRMGWRLALARRCVFQEK